MTGRIPRPRPLAVILLSLGLSLVLAVAVGVAGPPGARAATGPGFVQRCGVHFCLDGRTYYFAGANTYDVFTFGGSYGDTETQYMDKQRIDRHFGQLRADGVNVLRLWMFSHEDWHGFEKAKGQYNDQEFALFDYVIESAKAHDVRLIPVFENYWEAYGGIDTRLKWEGLPGSSHVNRAAFFDKAKCPGCFTQYKNYVSHALDRTNHYSGVKYRDDPTIFAWELMNEPRYQDVSADENASGKTLRAWVDEMGGYVKTIDPNHLLGTGLEGHEARYGFGGNEGNPFVTIHQSPYVDFTSAHPYTTEEWAGPMTLDATRALIRAYVRDSHEVVGKPFYLGEFNFKNVDRAAWWAAVYADFEAADGDGSGFWWYLDPANTASDLYSVKPGAPELAAFRSHSAAMAAKSGRSPSGSSGVSPSGSSGVSPSSSSGVSPSNSGVSPSRSGVSPSRSGVTPSRSTGDVPAACAVTYQVNGWTTGFVADVTVTNRGAAPLDGWTLTWSFTGDQAVSNGWNATVAQSGRQVTAKNLAWNGALAAGASANFGFQATSTGGGSAVPTDFALNGAACTA